MKLPRGIIPFCIFLFHFGFQKVSSTSTTISNDLAYCGFSDVEKHLCSSYCYNSVKPSLSYILELKEKIKGLEGKQSEIEQENVDLRKRLLEMANFKGQSEQIEELRTANKDLRTSLGLSVQQQNNIARIERFVIDVINKQKNEIEEGKLKATKDQEDLNKEIELRKIDKQQMEDIEKNLKKEIENLKMNLANEKAKREEAKDDLDSKSKELEAYRAKEESYSNEVKELNYKVTSCTNVLNETQTKLADKSTELESNSLRINQTEKNLLECKKKLPKSGCKGLPSGVHQLEVEGLDLFSASCNGDIEGGGWIVILNRFDGSVDFDRTWNEYRNGFGDVGGEFFIGLEKLHRITKSERYELYIQIGFFNGDVKFASHDNFKIGNEFEKYELKSLGEFKGTSENYMEYHLSQKFTTADSDNDNRHESNCALQFTGGWWYDSCYKVHLTGKYFKSGVTDVESMNWHFPFESLKSAQMLIRPKSTCL